MAYSTYKYLAIWLLLGVVVWGITKSEQLDNIPHEDILSEIVYNKRPNLLMLPHKNIDGKPLSPEEKKLLNEGKLARRFYSNKRGEIKEIRCFHINNSIDSINEKRLTILLDDNPFAELDLINIDCAASNMQYIYSRLFPDEPLTSDIDSLEYFRFFGLDNLTIVVSIIELCGFPVTRTNLKVACEVIAGAQSKSLKEYYFHQFTKARDLGLIDSLQYASVDSKIHKGGSFRTSKLDSIPDFFKNHPSFTGIDLDSFKRMSSSRIIEQLQKQ